MLSLTEQAVFAFAKVFEASFLMQFRKAEMYNAFRSLFSFLLHMNVPIQKRKTTHDKQPKYSKSDS